MPASLVSSKVLTPAISLSTPAPGTDERPFVGMSINVKDTGDTAVSGLQNAYALYCLSDYTSCIELPGSDDGQPRRALSTMRLGRQLTQPYAAGEYHLQSLYLLATPTTGR